MAVKREAGAGDLKGEERVGNSFPESWRERSYSLQAVLPSSGSERFKKAALVNSEDLICRVALKYKTQFHTHTVRGQTAGVIEGVLRKLREGVGLELGGRMLT